MVQTIVSQTSSYIVCFNFLCSAVHKIHFDGGCFQGFTSWRAQIWSKQLSHKQLLHYEFQLSMLSSSKNLTLGGPFWGGRMEFPPPPHQRTWKFSSNNCLTNNFLLYEFQLFMLSSSKN